MLKRVPQQTLFQIFKLGGLFLVLSLMVQLLVPVLTSTEAKILISQIGVFGPLILILFFVLSHVFAPVIGSPGILLGFALFGIWQTFMYLYIAGLISAAINFWLARQLGRNLVEKLLGAKDINELDHFIELTGTKMLIIARILGYPFFEIISYAVGLTNMDFKTYYVITIVFAPVPVIVSASLITHFGVGSGMATMIWVGGLLVAGGIFGYLLKRYVNIQSIQ